jgi:aryl-alcohol dehydrogenase
VSAPRVAWPLSALQVFLPQLIDFWKQGRFPFDKLLRTCPLSAIDEAEADSIKGTTIKPVILPEPAVAVN